MPLPDIGEGGTSEHGDPAQTVPVSSVQQCGACLEEPPAFDRARAAVAYEESSRQLILGFKHGQKIHLAHSFAYALLQRHGAMIAEADYIVPVPLHRWRLFRRGYNQAALIARLLAKESGRPALIEGLRRIRATKPQQGAAAARALNIKGAFAVGRLPPDFAGKRVLLVDDVLTTGATVEACARVLRGAGAGYVDVLCFARVIR
jgi:ComF family protein